MGVLQTRGKKRQSILEKRAREAEGGGVGRALQRQGWGLSLGSPFLGSMPSSPSSPRERRFLSQASRDADPAPSLAKLRLARALLICQTPRIARGGLFCGDADSSVDLNNGQIAWRPFIYIKGSSHSTKYPSKLSNLLLFSDQLPLVQGCTFSWWLLVPCFWSEPLCALAAASSKHCTT